MVWDFERYAERTALLDESGAAVAYTELGQMSRGLRAATGGRCLVFLFCRNEIGAAAGYAAMVEAGIVSFMLDARLESGRRENLLALYLPEFLWVPADMRDEFPGLVSVYENYGYLLLKTGYEKHFEPHPSLCILVPTSGSTGSSKCVRLSYDNLRAFYSSFGELRKFDGTERDTRPITSVPLHFVYGFLIAGIHLMAGHIILVTARSFVEKEFWNFFQEQQSTSLCIVPYSYTLLSKLGFFQMEFPSLNTICNSGGALTPEATKEIFTFAAERDLEFWNFYGQTEGTGCTGSLALNKSPEKSGAIGIANPDIQFGLVADDGTIIHEPNITGELVCEGPNVMLGYAERGEDLCKGDEMGGILHTGDMAWRDEDGFYYYAGRKSRFLKVYGNRVSLDELEALVKTEYPNLDCAAGGVDDHVYLFLVGEARQDEVRAYVARMTRLNPAAFQTVTMEEIPRTGSGKVAYGALAQWY